MSASPCTFRLVFLLLIGAIGNAFSENDPPNVLFILVDDLGWSDLSYMGSEIYETPNVDQLSREGMVFTDFYSGGPVCSPTRASIMTGKSTARTGITTFLITPDQDAPYVTHALPTSEFTIGEAFKKNNYATGYFGKWHLGYKQEDWVGNQGFDVAIGGLTSKNAWKMMYPDREPPVDRLETLMFSPHHFTHMKDGPKGEYLTDRLANETIDFIAANKSKPFFAFLSFHTVHTPLDAKPEVVEKYRKKIAQLGLLGDDTMEFGSRKFQNLPEYAAMVQHMDENIGRVLQALDSLELRENTIVVFTSDNGGKHVVTSNAPLRGAKHNLYEGGIRVATTIRYPEKIEEGTSSDLALISDDFYPTLLELAGLPLEDQQHVDGRSFKRVLLKNKTVPIHKALCWHYPHKRFEGAVRWKNFKLIYEYKTGKSELYDLSSDIGERNNLAKIDLKMVGKMKRMLRNWLKDTSARFPDEGMIMP
ncbi:UNVERIFIED_CONTAM: hypothetical protein GTU68_056997 [Idotea baltica]|nr:hypothetical protein [Idotea baltica]